jgi:hypothetical protein
VTQDTITISPGPRFREAMVVAIIAVALTGLGRAIAVVTFPFLRLAGRCSPHS